MAKSAAERKRESRARQRTTSVAPPAPASAQPSAADPSRSLELALEAIARLTETVEYLLDRDRNRDQNPVTIGHDGHDRDSSSVTLGGEGGGLALASPSDLNPLESETRARAQVSRSVTNPVTTVTKSVTTVTGAPKSDRPGERYVRLGEALPAELREAAAMLGLRDIPTAWAKFVGHYADQWVHVSGRWQKWAAEEAKRERAQAERDRESGVRPRALPADGNPNPVQRGIRPSQDEIAMRIAEAKASGGHGT